MGATAAQKAAHKPYAPRAKPEGIMSSYEARQVAEAKKAMERIGWEKEPDAEKRWRECIEQAKVHVFRMKTARFVICELAIKACDIRWGGGYHWDDNPNQYTLKNFAEEIGVHYKTLQNWVGVYRWAKQKLKDEKWGESDYEALRHAKQEAGRHSSPTKAKRAFKRSSQLSVADQKTRHIAKALRTYTTYMMSVHVHESNPVNKGYLETLKLRIKELNQVLEKFGCS